MNATTADLRHVNRANARIRAARPQGKPRRRTVALAVGAAFLGLYVLGVAWFADSLNEDMARSFQLAPAVADTQHR